MPPWADSASRCSPPAAVAARRARPRPRRPARHGRRRLNDVRRRPAPTPWSPPAGAGRGRRDPADQNVVVTQPTQGTFEGFSATCTHQGCQLATVAGGTINCGCHGSQFSITDGGNVDRAERPPRRVGRRARPRSRSRSRAARRPGLTPTKVRIPAVPRFSQGDLVLASCPDNGRGRRHAGHAHASACSPDRSASRPTARRTGMPVARRRASRGVDGAGPRARCWWCRPSGPAAASTSYGVALADGDIVPVAWHRSTRPCGPARSSTAGSRCRRRSRAARGAVARRSALRIVDRRSLTLPVVGNAVGDRGRRSRGHVRRCTVSSSRRSTTRARWARPTTSSSLT